MASENMVTVVGGLGRDPELRYTQGGRAVASFGLAVSRRYQVNGEWQEDTSWINVTVWGDLAENCAASLTKGARVMVAGRFQQREFETKEGDKLNDVALLAFLRFELALLETARDHHPSTLSQRSSTVLR